MPRVICFQPVQFRHPWLSRVNITSGHHFLWPVAPPEDVLTFDARTRPRRRPATAFADVHDTVAVFVCTTVVMRITTPTEAKQEASVINPASAGRYLVC